MAKLEENKIISWIHCNSCYSYYDESDRFYLVSCMHVFCLDCLEKRVIPNGKQCCFCKKQIRFKRIDGTLDPKLLAALDPDPSKDFNTMIRSLELNGRQMTHLHGGIIQAGKQAAEYEKMEQNLSAEEVKLKSRTAKVEAQNLVLKKMIAEEERKREMQERPREMVLSSSQNILSQRQGNVMMGPPPVPRMGGGGMHRSRPNVTRLSSISTGRHLF